jgi:hypothetical protein
MERASLFWASERVLSKKSISKKRVILSAAFEHPASAYGQEPPFNGVPAPVSQNDSKTTTSVTFSIPECLSNVESIWNRSSA